jgi:uroporphyrinogen-III synthase
LRVLVTRPRDDAVAFAARLNDLGHETLIEPMVELEALLENRAPLDLKGVQALIFTSANGVRVFAERTPRRDLPAFAVGDATAAAARGAGFEKVASAAGDVSDLAALVCRRLSPTGGLLFHPAASRQAGDLKGKLEAVGFELRRAVLYRAVPRQALGKALKEALTQGEIDAATFFSPRTAGSFARLVSKAGLSEALRGVRAICLSQAVADKITYLPWDGVKVAERPTQESLLAILEAC